MATEIITLSIDPEAARIFKSAPTEEREKLQVLLGIWLRELGKQFRLSEGHDGPDQRQSQGQGINS